MKPLLINVHVSPATPPVMEKPAVPLVVEYK
jgi:hypothetical protein